MTVTISVTACHQIGDGLACFGVGTVTISVTSLLTIPMHMHMPPVPACHIDNQDSGSLDGLASHRLELVPMPGNLFRRKTVDVLFLFLSRGTPNG